MMFPLVTVSMVEMQFKSVLLPEPDGPITPTNSPSQMSNDTSSSARVMASREPYTFRTSRTESRTLRLPGVLAFAMPAGGVAVTMVMGDSFLFDSVYPHDAALAKTEPSKGLTAILRCCKVCGQIHARAVDREGQRDGGARALF